MKILFVFLIAFSTFAQTKISLNNDGAEKYFTKQEMEDATRWVLGFANVEGHGKLNIPSTKFYEKKDLSGKVIAEIKNNEYFVNGKKKCYVAEIIKDFYVLVDLKPLGNKDTGETSLATNAKICESFPVLRSPSGGSDSQYLNMRVNVEGDVGSFRYKKQRSYFDIKPFLTQAGKVERDTETILKEKLSDEEMKALNTSLLELREFAKEENLEKLYKLIENGDNLSYDLHHRQRFLFKTKKEFFDKITDKKKFFYFMTKATYSKYSLNEGSFVNQSRLGKSLGWATKDFELRFNFSEKKQWRLSTVGPYYLNN